ncbi:histidine kinase [Flavobacterium sp. MFBS3-15]|uniref:tetratricopeptide repeat-containing sensor histidine kinase n=1 Tax=Flavobacterium sp. MFBS3-15 TaxID=2989816 RepID=UPI002235E3CD|nr:histidine kinase [Flavobacterium sp. MFBS3-15]MCW4470487.1 histidine kinase [Flavobacterium sp. MFBS3-15]
MNTMRRLNALILLYLMFLSPLVLIAQPHEQDKEDAPAEIKKAATDLEKSLIENDDYKIAGNYEQLAKEQMDKGDFGKAEENLYKAIEIYTNAKALKNRPRLLRNIAKAQEAQRKLKAAARNYKAASDEASEKAIKIINANDYARLQNEDNAEAESKYLEENIALLKKMGKKGEVADTYIQEALIKLKQEDTVAALENYSLALPYAVDPPLKAIKIYTEIAKLHVARKEYAEGVSAMNNLLDLARKLKDLDAEIIQLRYLATIYFLMEDWENVVKSLEESYKLAAAAGKTFEAKESLLQLAEYYKNIGDDKAGLAVYEEFLKNLDRIILSDNSLTDAKTFRVTEERIRRLESEKTLKDELIDKKNTFNYLLLGFLAVLILMMVSIVKALYAIKNKNKEIALQSLRREMNPHFLFNSLNSVNQFIAQNNELQANKYLTSYSGLMRNTMENSNKDFVTLGNEIENLTQYLELEHLRFKDKFDFEILVDDELDRETLWVPNMMLQPHLENAIWHGLRYKEGKGILKLSFKPDGKNMLVTIDDDGIGPTKSQQLKTHNQKAHESRGLTNTRERMTLINELYKKNIDFTVTEKTEPETGTIVRVTFPIIHKP